MEKWGLQNGNLVIKINWILCYTHPIEPNMEITTRGINNLYILYVFNIFCTVYLHRKWIKLPWSSSIVISATYRIRPELGYGCRVKLVELLFQTQRLVLFHLIVLGKIEELSELGGIWVGEWDLWIDIDVISGPAGAKVKAERRLIVFGLN